MAHKVIDVVDRANGKTCVTLLRYNGENPENSYAQVRLFAKTKQNEKFQQIVNVKYNLDDLFYLLDVRSSVCGKVITNKHICEVLYKIRAFFSYLFLQFESG